MSKYVPLTGLCWAVGRHLKVANMMLNCHSFRRGRFGLINLLGFFGYVNLFVTISKCQRSLNRLDLQIHELRRLGMYYPLHNRCRKSDRSIQIQDYFCGLFYSRLKGLDAIQVMLRFLPQTLGGFVGGISANYLLRKISTQIVFCLGYVDAGHELDTQLTHSLSLGACSLLRVRPSSRLLITKTITGSVLNSLVSSYPVSAHAT